MIERKMKFFEEGDEVFYIKKKIKISIHANDAERKEFEYFSEDIFAHEVWSGKVEKTEMLQDEADSTAMHYLVTISGKTYSGFNEVFFDVKDAERVCKKLNREAKAKLKECNNSLDDIIDDMFTGSYNV